MVKPGAMVPMLDAMAEGTAVLAGFLDGVAREAGARSFQRGPGGGGAPRAGLEACPGRRLRGRPAAFRGGRSKVCGRGSRHGTAPRPGRPPALHADQGRRSPERHGLPDRHAGVHEGRPGAPGAAQGRACRALSEGGRERRAREVAGGRDASAFGAPGARSGGRRRRRQPGGARPGVRAGPAGEAGGCRAVPEARPRSLRRLERGRLPATYAASRAEGRDVAVPQGPPLPEPAGLSPTPRAGPA